MLYPLIFRPIFKERIWGGDALRRLYGKSPPAGRPIGESWEISDRPSDISVIDNGSFSGQSLRWLLDKFGPDVLGNALPNAAGLFPLLAKIIDAKENLSLQVHPPPQKASELGGEPKTEMWYVAHAGPGAELWVGLKRGVTRKEFEDKIRAGTVAECFHRVRVAAGDAMFLPSGRVHALGAGIVIFEIQQNSDTTYRVFDWNRLDPAGKPRELHVQQSLASIDFEDIEPELAPSLSKKLDNQLVRQLVRDPLFDVDLVQTSGLPVKLGSGRMSLLAVVDGELSVANRQERAIVGKGGFCLIPAACQEVECAGRATFLKVFAGS